jgi:putative ABC transport system ATP-binding protein
MDADAAVVLERVNYHYGTETLRRQVLADVSTEIQRGEIVIVTGPSGAGKTTLLTLVGGLRTPQDGSVRVLGRELNGAAERDVHHVRTHTGYIFQSHNLLDWLTVEQNVQMALRLHPDIAAAERRALTAEILGAVGLADRAGQYPEQLSGGQRQRVAIARALVSRPQIILADEPTASLDRKSGRDVVELIHRLAKQQGCAVLMVAHDNRILDVADRIVHLEDGRLVSFSDAVLSDTRQLFGMLTHNTREVTRRLAQLPEPQFISLLDRVTAEFQQFLHVVELSRNDALEGMLEQVIEAFTFKVGQILGADRATLFLVDAPRRQLWSKVAQSDSDKALEIRIPIDAGIAGHVATTGTLLNVADAYREPLFDREVDERTGYRTRSLLCVPIADTHNHVFAVAQLLNKRGDAPFDAGDERRFRDFAASIGVILQSWWWMRQRLFAAETTENAPSPS